MPTAELIWTAQELTVGLLRSPSFKDDESDSSSSWIKRLTGRSAEAGTHAEE